MALQGENNVGPEIPVEQPMSEIRSCSPKIRLFLAFRGNLTLNSMEDLLFFSLLGLPVRQKKQKSTILNEGLRNNLISNVQRSPRKEARRYLSQCHLSRNSTDTV